MISGRVVFLDLDPEKYLLEAEAFVLKIEKKIVEIEKWIIPQTGLS